MEKNQTENAVKAIISNLWGWNENDIKDDLSIKDDLGADSLDLVELIIEVEKALNLILPENQLENAQTVGEFIEIIHEIKNQ